jgi:GTP-binding protein
MFKLQGTPLRVQFKKGDNPFGTKPGDYKPDVKGVMRGEKKPAKKSEGKVTRKPG